ncbi:LysE family translocator [Arcicella lustrica]|uniref:LysE family transporter n=1 Tax=Arcicella lustrica TaxID=2984196 RepID=A0ABU5SJJ7_9BACT|nr:LysE family transporter [Arcicella sp. DC25W]MEA5427477.1 LysE family transporter [Arcicella sp. DC25W]
MINAVVFGFLYGFLLCFTFGPAFFRLIQTSIDNGFKRGVLIAGGVTVADAILMFCAVFGTSFLPKLQYFNLGIALVGASILFILGFNSLFKQQTQLVYPKSKLGSFLYYFTSGILLNLLNPSNYIAVFATSTYLSNVEGFSINETIVFFIASLFATMLAESLIAFYAQKMKRILTANILKRINQVAGIIFIISGILILWKQFW